MTQPHLALITMLRATRLARSMSALTFLGVYGLACTDTQLSYVDPAARQSISANIQAPPPDSAVPPTYILYVDDISYSTILSDPNGLRQQLFDSIVNTYKGYPNVYYGIVTFSDAPYVQTLNFTNSPDQLAQASTNLNANLDGGNFSDTLYTAYTFLSNSLAQHKQAQSQLSQYYIYWVSTGIPNIGISSPQSIDTFVQGIVSYMNPKVAHFELDTAFLSYLPPGTSPAVQAQYAQSQAVLAGMATAGNGNLTILSNDLPTNLSFGVNVNPLAREFYLQWYYVRNMNTGWSGESPAPDSDGDGIVDDVETELGSNPLEADTDGDGYRDGIEVQFPNTLHLLTYDAGCTSIGTDTDKDDLWDCEENIFGSSPSNPDTNGNFLLDGDEAFSYASPISLNPTRDIDQDGYTDFVEVTNHTSVNIETAAETYSLWSYDYSKQTTPATQAQPEGDILQVRNLSMQQTLATRTTPLGNNVFKIVCAFAPSDTAGPVQFYQATVSGQFILKKQGPSVGLHFQLDSSHFTALPLAYQ